MDFDVLILGGGVAGMSCALILGSAKDNSYAQNKEVGIIVHQKASDLQSALLNNALGIDPGTSGDSVLKKGKKHLSESYPHVRQIEKEKVLEIGSNPFGYSIRTNKNTYNSTVLVLALGYSDLLHIKGLKPYIIPHQKAKASKNRIQLKNNDHLVAPNLYVAGTLAGHRSQFAIAAGSGAAVATDILTIWNGGQHTKVHDKLK
ncbi:MAG: FAD-dependent oxidoreductase [Gillisia sp.]